MGKRREKDYLHSYCPGHPRANNIGYVYTHVLVAEKNLGRFLTSEECVHHEDRNRFNNLPDNIVVFKTVADHTAFHNGVPRVLDGDVWWCPSKNAESKDLCPICKKNYKYDEAEMCLECRNKQRRETFGKYETPSREALKREIRTMTFTEIGQKYGVTDNAVRKLCKFYNLPYRTRDILLYSDVEWETETPSQETLEKIERLNKDLTDEEVIFAYCKNPKLGALPHQLNMDRKTIKEVLVKYNFRILNNGESKCIKVVDQYLPSGKKVGSFLIMRDAARWLLENGHTGNNHTLSKIVTRISKSLDTDSTAFGFIWKSNDNITDYRDYLINKQDK
jgi:hypothetical protein